MRTSKETGTAIGLWVHKTLPPDHHEDIRALLDDHTHAVAYEAQKHILDGLRAHAQKHWGGIVHWSEISEAVGNAWKHEIDHIDSLLEELERMNKPATEAVEEHPMMAVLREVFGEGVRITTTEELMNSPEFGGAPTPAGETSIDEPDTVEAPKYPQINKFADRFVPTHRHIRTNSHYRKIGDASVEATMDHVVVYMNHRGETFVRPVAEFLERFEELN